MSPDFIPLYSLVLSLSESDLLPDESLYGIIISNLKILELYKLVINV